MTDAIDRPLTGPTAVWRVCLEEAWAAYLAGSVPVGAVFVDERGDVRWRGRNRVHESDAPPPQVAGSRVAHAELNVLVQASPETHAELGRGTLFTTLEPCLMCLGALTLCGVRRVVFAASDGVAGAASLVGVHPYIVSRGVAVKGPEATVGRVSLAWMTDAVLRSGSPRTSEFLAAFRADDPVAVAVGEAWYRAGVWRTARADGLTLDHALARIRDTIGV